MQGEDSKAVMIKNDDRFRTNINKLLTQQAITKKFMEIKLIIHDNLDVTVCDITYKDRTIEHLEDHCLKG